METLSVILACDPPPKEIWVHIDKSDGVLEGKLSTRFPGVHVLSSPDRLGPGFGRHRCLQAINSDIACSFDDDSYPLVRDYFSTVATLFLDHPEAALMAAAIVERGQPVPEATPEVRPARAFGGGGHAIRVAAYQSVRGYVPRSVAYGLEESDLALQLREQDHAILQCNLLQVFHDSDLSHHDRPEIVAGVVANKVVLPFLRYPVLLWPLGALQLASTLAYCMRRRRWRGILAGLSAAPRACRELRAYRQPVRVRTVLRDLAIRPAVGP
jgi:hypothetical protein